jgi:poly-gamma-glutamate synthesis protein (capsule biosynthesis protein)
VRIFIVGDIVLDEPQADRFFDLARETLRGADVLIGHVEVPHTTRGIESRGDVPAPASAPENLEALGRAGFHVATLGGNHIHDRGAEGIADTIANLTAQGVAVCGAGEDLVAARTPAVVTRGGRSVAVLSYNCVGPKAGWAGERRSGCAYVHVLTHYELEGANPGGPPKIYSFCDPDTLEAMQDDVAAAKLLHDVVVVSLHKGLVHTPSKLAMYERPLARAAVDAGADIVAGCHAHILRGIEIYKDRPIFHGLGNFVVVTRALTVEGNASPERRAWARRRQELFGFTPDPEYPLYPFHPEAKNAMIAVCDADGGGVDAGFIPCWVHPAGQIEPLARSEQGEAVRRYVADITAREGFKVRCEWAGDLVRVRPSWTA